MKRVIEILNEFKSNSGNKLQEILQENIGNKLLLEVLYFVYNPFITTGLSKKKINKKVSCDNIPTANNIKDVFDYLKMNNTGTDNDIAYVQNFIKSQPIEYKEIYKQIFTKELKIGLTAKTINKVIPNLIPEFNIMLSEKYYDRMEELEENKPDIIITTKLDGIRVIAQVKDGEVRLFSRQGKLITGLVDIEEELLKLPEGYWDGELLLDKIGLPSKDLYRETVSVVNSKNEEKRNVIFNIFDYISLIDFSKGKSETPCIDRKNFIYEELRKIEAGWLAPLPILYNGVYNKEKVNEQLGKQRNLQNEGIMINIANAPYEAKRSKNLLKVKVMQDCDIEIIGFEEGSGQNTDTLGAVVTNYKGNTLKVGSGFSKEERDYIWNNRSKLLGRICKVQYFEETKNKDNDSLSLRFPVWQGLCPEGKEISYY